MKESDIKIAELSMCVMLYKTVLDLKNGRLKGLVCKLSKEAERQIATLKRPGEKDLSEIGVALKKFEKLSGWCKDEKHLQTYVSAITLIIEKRGYKKINSILVDINDYHARHKEIPAACYWSGEIVEQKWRDSFYK